MYSYDLKPAGAETNDKVFVLSQSEAEKYFPTSEDRKCMYFDKKEFHSWWLRTPGSGSIDAEKYVDSNGDIGEMSSDISFVADVRPAVWVSLR